ncbi:uncharacterized protein si:ch1073-126c3.2 [Scophthalmus maximus]|uniref:uncharacterized protein si:ch1073-126c3.2 n=1 Tax=Scophthalmus maximus TaxID=52904 RepID=UPI001FA883B9|nr:uncharacterized protein si:ch1073-126c3.2 [Scophthalmus maximus]
MASKGTWIWICSLAALSVAAAQVESVMRNCTTQTDLLERLSADVKGAVECSADLPSVWTRQQSSALLLSMRNLTGLLHRHQLTDCQGAEPKKCPKPEVPSNGGLACVTVGNKRYCKPLCNFGYDFSFLRRSRLFEECSERTGYKWETQFIGGNNLAVCNEATSQVSGSESAYFPKDQDCLTTQSQLRDSFLQRLNAELQVQGVQGQPKNACLVCG